MSLLHSFYCWGHVGVVLLSTLFFAVFGIENWKILSFIWAVIPIFNAVYCTSPILTCMFLCCSAKQSMIVYLFTKTPLAPLISDGEKGMTLSELAKSKMFWVLMLMMICSGASEQAVSQWASAFAEQGLGISKAAGDLAGPMAFAILMGASRAFYGKYGDRIDLNKFMAGSSILCICSYLLISLVLVPAVSLIGCAVCGLSVGIMWPGTFSHATASLKHGGTAMFALLALAGDLGCSGGPTLVGLVSDAAGRNMKTGILAAVVFPALFTVCLIDGKRNSAK